MGQKLIPMAHALVLSSTGAPAGMPTKDFANHLIEDHKIRKMLKEKYL